MNLTLPATAASVELGLSLVADAIRADLKALGYRLKSTSAIIVSYQTQMELVGMTNYTSIPWVIAVWVHVKTDVIHFQAYGDKIESAFADLIKKLPAATEANA